VDFVKESWSKNQAIVEIKKVSKNPDAIEEKCEVNNKRKRAGMKLNKFSAEEVLRIEKAIANKENTGALAKEMGRTYGSVNYKIRALKRAEDLNMGNFTVEENERIKQALENNEDFKDVAKELCRNPNTVYSKMLVMKSNPKSEQGQKLRLSIEEDLLILDKVMPQLKFKKLSSSGFLSQSEAMELGTELHRNFKSVRLRWESNLQPMLLQHYTGTSDFRVEKMLTRLVAKKYKDHREIDWSEILNQHEEFAGHTNASISAVFQVCFKAAKRQKKADAVSLQEVAEFTAVFQVRKEPAAKIVHREKIVEYFQKRIEELGINFVV